MHPSKPVTQICGHRGASGVAPENTLVAFQRALDEGASWIEFDVHLSMDGEVVVFHDDTLERTTDLNLQKRPEELTLKELKQLDAGSWFDPRFAGERIPTLDEVLQTFKGKLGMNIEIKTDPQKTNSNNGLEYKVADILARYDLFDIKDVIVNSIDPERLIKLHAYAPKIPIGVIYSPNDPDMPTGSDLLALVSLTAARALHPDHLLTDEQLMYTARQAGVMVNTWTVNAPVDMRRMVDLGVDMIMTDYPSVLREVMHL
jgi:glycerophosphoryl diester phosphodiesterase